MSRRNRLVRKADSAIRRGVDDSALVARIDWHEKHRSLRIDSGGRQLASYFALRSIWLNRP